MWNALSPEQRQAVDFALKRSGAGLFLEQGVGKTWVPLGLLDQDRSAKDALFVVRLANKETSWQDAFTQWLPDWNVYLDWDTFKAAPQPRLLLLHIEALRRRRQGARGRKRGLIDKVAKHPWDLVTVDESQSIKARSSEQSTSIAKLATAKRRIALSGTPMDADPSDLWAQMRFIEPDEFGTVWKDFDLEFLTQPTVDPKKYKPGTMAWKRAMLALRIQKNKAKLRPDKSAEFTRRLKKHCLRITKEVLNLPPSRDIPVLFDLLGNQRRLYEQLESTSLATLPDGETLMAALAIVKDSKLAQVPGRFLIDEDGEVHTVGKGKVRQLALLVPRLRKPFVVFALYRQELEVIRLCLESQGLRCETLSGKVKKANRPSLIRAFQAGQLDALIIQSKTGGVGIDLQVAADAVFYSFSHSWIDFDQAKARLERRGQTRSMRFFYLIARNTVDEDKWTSVSRKQALSSATLDRLKRRRL